MTVEVLVLWEIFEEKKLKVAVAVGKMSKEKWLKMLAQLSQFFTPNIGDYTEKFDNLI